MSKTYRYKDLSFTVAANEDVTFRVEFISDGNSGPTAITTPGPYDPTIQNANSAYIGKGENLRGISTSVSSLISNLNLHEDEIRVKYYINNVLLLEHSNLKSESSQSSIELIIKFNVL